MSVVSSIFLVVSLVLAVVIGPQTRSWTWGPAMLALGISVLAALPVFWKRGKQPGDFGMLALGMVTAGWFVWRAWTSPVAELANADLLLLAGVVGAFTSIRSISGNQVAERILGWGIALLLLANLVVIGKQVMDPSFSPVFRERSGSSMVTGFFAHYIEAANYLVASSMLVGAAALFGRNAKATQVVWGLIAIAGIAGVWFTRARGGILGAAIACAVFAVLALVIEKRKNTRWFGPAVIAIPVIALGIAAFLFMGWKEAQVVRFAGGGNAGAGIEEIFDNHSRLYFLGIALSCIGLHPLAGGGSRSFGWESLRFLDGKAQGDLIYRKPDLVHNELLQTAADYGILGAGLLVGLMAALTLAVILRVLFEEIPRERDVRDAWRIGGLAALAGLLVQSCFGFVFHLLPGILLLGISMGQMLRSPERSDGTKNRGSRILLSAAGLSCAALLLVFGWKGLRVTRILWPSHFSKHTVSSSESQIDALTEAIHIWPQSTFYQNRAILFQQMTDSDGGTGSRESVERAINDYHEASRLNPFDPAFEVNRANLLSRLERDAEAEEAYARAVRQQGGMEQGFQARFSLAKHLHNKGIRLFDPANPETSRLALELAAETVEKAAGMVHWVSPDLMEPRISIHESLGIAREAAGERDGALGSYDFASKLPGGIRVHYRAGVLIGKRAVENWSKRRPAEALADFIEARRRVELSRNHPPEGVTLSQCVEYIDYLDRRIAFLKGARVEPAK